MTQDLEFYVDVMSQLLDDDSARDENYAKIDEAVGVVWENPEEIRKLEWIKDRKFPTTAFADARNAATRAYATRLPKLTIFPAVDSIAQYGQTEKLETAMEWELERLNRIGKKPAHWKIVESAMTYCAVAVQTEYLPYCFKGRSDGRIKNILNQAKFAWNVHHPGTVHSKHSDYGLECVGKAVLVTVQDLVYKFGEDNEGIKKLLKDLAEDGKDLDYATTLSYYDFTDWTDRVQWAGINTSGATITSENMGGSTWYEFRREEHGLPFIPWVIVDNEDPIMLTALKAGLYETSNILNTIVFSKAVDMAAHPELWIQTSTGDLSSVYIDNSNPSQPVVSQTGQAQIQPMPPRQIDPQLSQIQQEANAAIFRSTVAQVLADVSNVAPTATFSTVNAMLQAGLAQLALGGNAAERAETLATYQNFQWLEYSKIPLVAYRRKGKKVGDTEAKAGQEIVIKPNYTGENPNIVTFDLGTLYLEIKLRSTSIQDKQAELNNEVMKVERLGKSRAAALEDIGEENFDLDQARRAEEDLFLARVGAEAQRIQMQPELEAQQAMQQQAMEQQAQAQNAQTEQRGEIFSPQQGMDNRMGMGAGAAGAAPGMNVEQMTGESRGGMPLA